MTDPITIPSWLALVTVCLLPCLGMAVVYWWMAFRHEVQRTNVLVREFALAKAAEG